MPSFAPKHEILLYYKLPPFPKVWTTPTGRREQYYLAQNSEDSKWIVRLHTRHNLSHSIKHNCLHAREETQAKNETLPQHEAEIDEHETRYDLHDL